MHDLRLQGMEDGKRHSKQDLAAFNEEHVPDLADHLKTKVVAKKTTEPLEGMGLRITHVLHQELVQFWHLLLYHLTEDVVIQNDAKHLTVVV